MDNKNKSWIKWIYLVLGSTALLLGGIIYSWSILKSPLADGFGWGTTELALNYTIMMCMFFFGGFLSGLLSKRISANIRLFISAILVFAGFFISSKLSGGAIWPLYIAYGVCAGIGIGFLYNSSVSVISGWFTDKRGLCSGVLLTCFGFSTLIFGGLAGRLINNPSVGWRSTFLILGSAMAIAVAVLGIVLREAPASAAVDKKINKETDKQAAVTEKIPGAGEFTTKEMIRRASFWKVFIVFTLISSTGSCAISFAKDFALFAGAHENFAITVVGLLSVCNGLARIFSGILYDRVSLKSTQWIISLFAVLAPVCGAVALLTDIYVLEIVTLLLCGFSFGLCPTSTALYPKLLFGEKNYASNFGVMNLHAMVASFSATLAGFMIASTGSYMPVFIMLIGFAAVASALLISVRKA